MPRTVVVLRVGGEVVEARPATVVVPTVAEPETGGGVRFAVEAGRDVLAEGVGPAFYGNEIVPDEAALTSTGS